MIQFTKVFELNEQRVDERSLKLRTERGLGFLFAENSCTKQANMRAHAGHIRHLESGTHDQADSSHPSFLPNSHFLLIRRVVYLVVDICFTAIQYFRMFYRCCMKIIMHNDTFCQNSTENWSIKHKLFIIHPKALAG